MMFPFRTRCTETQGPSCRAPSHEDAGDAPTIDLNCDLGEIDTPEGHALDAALLGIVTSANIACGGHAGDDATMRRVIDLALRHGVAIGAHPSYPDRPRFGRVDLAMSDHDVEATVAEQIGALADAARRAGATITHVKPHGALYHAAMRRPGVAGAVLRAAHAVLPGPVPPGPVLVGLAGPGGAVGLEAWRFAGARVAGEGFADRRYEPDGALRARDKPAAVLADHRAAGEQAVSIARDGLVTTDVGLISLSAQTLCVHSDSPDAPGLARAVVAALASAGVRLAALAPHPS